MVESDDVLIQACLRGEASAWETLLERYERLVYSVPRSYGFSADDAADVAQLTFTILLQSLESLRTETRLAPWLATVARRHTWRMLTKRRRESPDPEDDISLKSEYQEIAVAESESEQWETQQWLGQGLTQLPERCRDLLQALYFDPTEPSYTDIAATLKMPLGSIGPTRSRCLQRLRDLLQES